MIISSRESVYKKVRRCCPGAVSTPSILSSIWLLARTCVSTVLHISVWMGLDRKPDRVIYLLPVVRQPTYHHVPRQSQCPGEMRGARYIQRGRYCLTNGYVYTGTFRRLAHGGISPCVREDLRIRQTDSVEGIWYRVVRAKKIVPVPYIHIKE